MEPLAHALAAGRTGCRCTASKRTSLSHLSPYLNTNIRTVAVFEDPQSCTSHRSSVSPPLPCSDRSPTCHSLSISPSRPRGSCCSTQYRSFPLNHRPDIGLSTSTCVHLTTITGTTTTTSTTQAVHTLNTQLARIPTEAPRYHPPRYCQSQAPRLDTLVCRLSGQAVKNVKLRDYRVSEHRQSLPVDSYHNRSSRTYSCHLRV